MRLHRRLDSPAADREDRALSSRLTTAYVALAATDTWLSGRHESWAHRARWVTKPALMPVLVGSLLASPAATGSPLRSSTVLAQAAGWGGDVSLLREGTGAFLTGACSFALGHGAYLAGFRSQRREDPLLAATGPRLVLATAATTTPVIAALAGRHDRVLGAAVPAYAAALAAMTSAALHLDPALPRRARLLTGTGAVLFMVSDTVLAWRTFTAAPAQAAPGVTTPIDARPDPWEHLVMGTYTSAQLLLSLGARAGGASTTGAGRPARPTTRPTG